MRWLRNLARRLRARRLRAPCVLIDTRAADAQPHAFGEWLPQTHCEAAAPAVLEDDAPDRDAGAPDRTAAVRSFIKQARRSGAVAPDNINPARLGQELRSDT